MANQLAKDYKFNIIVYTWDSHDKIDWGKWDKKIKVRIVPYSKYFQKWVAKLLYFLWIKIDRPNQYILNFLYHGETILPEDSKINYVLHSPASLIPHRYKYIQEKANKFNQLLFIAVSDYVKQDAIPYLGKMKIEVIHHGIDLKRFSQTIQYNTDKKMKILTVAALEKWKGIQDMIQALADNDLNKDFEYYIIGDGPYKPELVKLINELDISSSIYFMNPQDKIEEVLPHYDIYCQLSEGEAFGLSVIESMACGLPSIVYDIPPFDFIIPSNAAKKVKNKSQPMLKKYLSDLTDKNERERIGENGRNYVRKNYSVEKMALNYYNHIVEYV